MAESPLFHFGSLASCVRIKFLHQCRRRSITHYFKRILMFKVLCIVGPGTGEHGFSTKWFASRNFSASNLRRPSSITRCNLVYFGMASAAKTVRNDCQRYGVVRCSNMRRRRRWLRSKQLQTNVILLLRKTNWTIFIVHCSMYPTVHPLLTWVYLYSIYRYS